MMALVVRPMAAQHAPIQRIFYPKTSAGYHVRLSLRSEVEGQRAETIAAVTYAVQYSPDNGASWYPLAVDVAEPNLLLDSAALGKTDSGILRVLATDGLNTTVVERRGLNVF